MYSIYTKVYHCALPSGKTFVHGNPVIGHFVQIVGTSVKREEQRIKIRFHAPLLHNTLQIYPSSPSREVREFELVATKQEPVVRRRPKEKKKSPT